MMRVLLVSASRGESREPVFPLGTAYVASALLREGAEVEVFDAGLHPSPLRSLRRAMERFPPDIVGLSLRYIDNAAYPRSRCYLPEYAGIVSEVRAASRAPILLGGSAFSLFPEDLMRILRAEGGATGDGEDGMLRLIRGKEGPIVRGRLENLDSVEFPRKVDSLFPGFQRYRVIGVQTMRGCSQSCIHCTNMLIEGNTLRPRSPGAVADDLEYLFREHGKRNFLFVDSAFNSDEGHMAGVCRAILSRDLPIRFACYLRPTISDPSLFGLLAGAGCVSVEFDTDAGSDRMLQTLRKGFTTDDIRAASNDCRKARIEFCHNLLFGGPGENPETLMDEIAPKAVVAMTGIRIYPRTKLHQIAIREGVLSPDDLLLGPRHFFPGNDSYWLQKQVGEAAARRRNWFLPGRRSLRRALATRLLRSFHSVGPPWKMLRQS
jgi:radical SAM superfamily enzyme YgiQ (UPF0313 family)